MITLERIKELQELLPHGNDFEEALMDVDMRELLALAEKSLKAKEALQASLALGNKVYHNANAHQAPLDWVRVKALIEEALK